MKKYLVTIFALLLGVQSMTGVLLVHAKETTDLLIASVHTEASEISPVQSERVVQEDATEFYLASIYVTNWISDTEKETLALLPVYERGKLKKLLEQTNNQELPKSIINQLDHLSSEATKEQPLQIEKYGLRWFVKVKDTVYENGKEVPLKTEVIPKGLFKEAFTVRNLYADYMQQSANQLEQPGFPEPSTEPSTSITETINEEPQTQSSEIIAEPITEDELPQQQSEEVKENRSSSDLEKQTIETTESTTVEIEKTTDSSKNNEAQKVETTSEIDSSNSKTSEPTILPNEIPLLKKVEFSRPILLQSRALSLSLFSNDQLPTYIPMKIKDEKSGSITKEQPKVYYKIQVPILSEKLDIRQTKISCKSNFDSYGTLYDAQWKTVVSNNNGGRDRDFQIQETLKGGTYYLEVRGYSQRDRGSYQIVSRQVKEGDQNHSFTTAAVINFGDVIEGEISNFTGKDYYKFTLPALSKQDYFVEDIISCNSDFNSYGTLYDSEFKEIEYNNSDYNGNDFEIRRTLKGGTYYLEVGSYSETFFSAYKITTKRETKGDQNYSFATAQTLNLTTSRTGKIERSNRFDDVDYFKLEIPKDGKYRIDSEINFYIHGTLYDKDQNKIIYTTDTPTREFKIDRLLTKGTYYLVVKGFIQMCIGDYKLKLSLLNDDIEAIDFNKFYGKEVKPEKEKFYKILVTNEGNYEFDFESDETITLYFFDGEKGTSEEVTSSSEDNDWFTFSKKLDSGTYYIKVDSSKKTVISFRLSPNYREDLKEYKIYAMVLEDYRTEKVRTFWRLEKNNRPVNDSSLYKYLESSGNYLPTSMFTFVDREKMNQIEEGYLKAGYHPTTGEEVPSWLLPIIYSSYLIEDGYQFVTESELGNALLTLGYVYSMYRLTKINGTKQITKKTSGLGKLQDINIKKFEIKNKHLNSSTAKRARKFNVYSSEEANKIVQDALKNGKLVETIPNGVGSQGQNSFSSIIDTGKVIGTKGETHIKIVYDELKNVWTTYPVTKP